VPQGNVVMDTKVYKLFGYEGNCIVSYDFPRTPKTRQNISFQEFNDDIVNGLNAWYHFNPLCEIFRGYEDPLMLAGRGWMNLINKVQTPLLEWSFY
jgi:hypothetical protein